MWGDRQACRPEQSQPSKKIKAGEPLKEEDVDIRGVIAKKSPDDKVVFYKGEKRKREEQAENAKRTMSNVKGALETGTSHSNDWADIDDFQTFEDFAIRQIALRRAQNEKDCEPLWADALRDPDQVCVFRRGQWLLGKYSGLQHADRQSETMSISVKRAAHINTQEDLEEYKRVATDTYQRRIASMKGPLVKPAESPFVSKYDVEGDTEPDMGAQNAFGSKSVNKLLMEELADK